MKTDDSVIGMGQVLADKYRIVRAIGQGGMGAVFEAHHMLLDRRFAIKFLRPELTRSAEMVARFRREATAAGRVEHEHVVAVTDCGVMDSGIPYLVMEYLDGETLAETLKREGALAFSRAVGLVVQACHGLIEAHTQGVIHRDLKPGNLFLCQRGRGNEHIKVLDFGIAKLILDSDSGGPITRTGTALGTPHYMSPEQARGEEPIDQRTDIYSLGAVLYECLSGARPHPGTSYNEILFHILTQPPVPLDERDLCLPVGLRQVVERAMASRVAERYEQMVEFLCDLLPFAPHPQCSLVELHQARTTSDPSLPTLAAPATHPSDPASSLEGSLPLAVMLDRDQLSDGEVPARRASRHIRWVAPIAVAWLIAIAFGVSVSRERSLWSAPSTISSRGTAEAMSPAPSIEASSIQHFDPTAAPVGTWVQSTSGDAESPQSLSHSQDVRADASVTAMPSRPPRLPARVAPPMHSVTAAIRADLTPDQARSKAGAERYDSKNPYRQ